MGVLDELKHQATVLRQADEERARSLEARTTAALAAALPAVFRIHLHLRDLAEQLRILQPDIRIALDIPGLGAVPGFKQETMEVDADGNPPDRVTARFVLRYERRGQFELKGVGSVNSWLDNARRKGLLVKLVRMLEPPGGAERALVTLVDSVAASIEFSIDRESGTVALLMRNFEQLGERRQGIRPEEVTSRWLDELTRFILRQPHRFLVQELPPDLRENLRRRLELDKRRALEASDGLTALSPRLKGLFRRRQALKLAFRGLRHELSEVEVEFLIGRSDACDLVVPEARVSRFHARIEQHDGRFLLVDESRNGTWVRFEDGTQQRVGTTPVALSGRGVIGLCAPPDASNPHIIEFEL
jgi:hypothetical protein